MRWMPGRIRRARRSWRAAGGSLQSTQSPPTPCPPCPLAPGSRRWPSTRLSSSARVGGARCWRRRQARASGPSRSRRVSSVKTIPPPGPRACAVPPGPAAVAATGRRERRSPRPLVGADQDQLRGLADMRETADDEREQRLESPTGGAQATHLERHLGAEVEQVAAVVAVVGKSQRLVVETLLEHAGQFQGGLAQGMRLARRRSKRSKRCPLSESSP